MANLRVFKYPLEFHGSSSCVFDLPKHAKVLKLAMQHGKETLWAMVDPEAEVESREIIFAGTGWRLSSTINEWQYLETIFAPDGTVWHYFLKDK
jgi:hypothetical protein